MCVCVCVCQNMSVIKVQEDTGINKVVPATKISLSGYYRLKAKSRITFEMMDINLIT